jgi:hypothetical protein
MYVRTRVASVDVTVNNSLPGSLLSLFDALSLAHLSLRLLAIPVDRTISRPI